MPVVYEEPKKEHEKNPTIDGSCIVTHPAYAQVRVSHVNGGAHLYGSDFQHQGYVCLTIARSHLRRNLSTDWPSEREELIEIAMSEAQYAAMVSNPNRGSGIQCTLQHINGKSVPQIPAPEQKKETFKLEANESGREALKRIESLSAEIQNSKLSAKQKEAWLKDLDFIRDRTRSNLSFVLKCFGEYMEDTVQKARTEINAYIQHAITHTGIAKIIGSDKAKKLLGYRDKDEE